MNKQIALDFVEAINASDIERMYLLMSGDHTFIDAANNDFKGRDRMKSAWISYFQLFPDYHIEITDTMEQSNTVALMGFASGTYGAAAGEENHFHLPAAWKAVIRDGKVSLWQVFCDTKLPSEILERNGVQF